MRACTLVLPACASEDNLSSDLAHLVEGALDQKRSALIWFRFGRWYGRRHLGPSLLGSAHGVRAHVRVLSETLEPRAAAQERGATSSLQLVEGRNIINIVIIFLLYTFIK